MTMKTNVALAIAAASLFTAAAFANTHNNANTAKVHCYGGNECKGKSECKCKNNACKGMNECKGKGMTMMTPEDCKKHGGSLHEKH